MTTTRVPLSDEMIAVIERGVAALRRDLAEAQAKIASMESNALLLAEAQAKIASLESRALLICLARNEESGLRDKLVKRIASLHTNMNQIKRLAQGATTGVGAESAARIAEIAAKAVIA
jgi:hypothetical protein